MKRIVFLVCGFVLLVANTAEARRSRGGYSQPMYAQPTYVYAAPATTAPATQAAAAKVTTAAHTASSEAGVKATPASHTTTTKATKTTNAFDTSSAQGVANIMASRGQVGHFGGNPGYEGCGMGPTKESAYSICCYGNSGMATVDVGYAQSANGMWYCCRRYR